MAPQHIALAVIVAALWGFNFVVIKVGLDHYPPFLLTFMRFAIACLPVLFIPRPRISTGKLVVIGMVWFFADPTMDILPTIWFVAIAALWQREMPSGRQIAGMTVAFCGLTVIALTIGGSTGAGEITMLGLLLCLASALSWATGNVMVRVTGGKVDMTSLVIWGCLVPLVPAFLMSLLFEGWPLIVSSITSVHWAGVGAIFYLAIAATWVGFGIWGKLLKIYPAAQVAPFSMLVPVFGTLSAVLVLGERFSPQRLVGMALVVTGLLVVSLPMPRAWRKS
ncbi:MAG: hypothetical protein B7Z15_16150 [Rhizobiales bacterium 32-66-8]|nr:MAG: hypothetical protein B7Z15_16150 [Rhizobiales bacterium 32-66-8]